MVEKYETPEYEVIDITKLKAEVEKLKKDLVIANGNITQLISALKLKVDKADIISQINISPEGILIDGKKIHITSETMIDDKLKYK
ncbi:hypothetical protein [Lactiplantibacillus plantarum]|uniref:hypothetical protein n=1 Tax=Lactiplantibacillus plantarum TaxID=1590 RepID=UPI00070B39D2|nr:hypothetical protein [Lactiplantibacillus plantarum]KRN34438.1 hypothetical protein IV39_GL002256 [Lactiplantibacillus plantarum]